MVTEMAQELKTVSRSLEETKGKLNETEKELKDVTEELRETKRQLNATGKKVNTGEDSQVVYGKVMFSVVPVCPQWGPHVITALLKLAHLGPPPR